MNIESIIHSGVKSNTISCVNQIGQTKDVCNMGRVKVHRAIVGYVGLGVQRCNAGISLHSDLSVSGANVCDKCRVAKSAINTGTGVQKYNVTKTINLSRGSLERSWVVTKERLLCMAGHSREGGQVSLHIKKLEPLPISCTARWLLPVRAPLLPFAGGALEVVLVVRVVAVDCSSSEVTVESGS